MSERRIEITVAGQAALIGAREALGKTRLSPENRDENGPAKSLGVLAKMIEDHSYGLLTETEENRPSYRIGLNWEEGDYLGLKERELNILLTILDELLLNILHAIPNPPPEEADTYTWKQASIAWTNAYFQRAAELGHLEAMARFGIVFDDKTERGQVFVTQPIIPGETLEFDIEEATKARVLKKGGRHFHKGGIFEINEGFFAERLDNEGLLHTPVKTIDELVDPQNPAAGYRRRVWMEFQRNPEYTWQPVLLG